MSRYSYAIKLTGRGAQAYEDYPEIRAWYDEVSVTKSERTAPDYVDSFAGLIQELGKEPEDLVKLNGDQAYELLMDWAIKKRKSKVVSDGRIKQIWYGAVSFFKFHKIKIESELPFSQMQITFKDKIPTRLELKQILDAAPGLSTKIAIQLLAYSGIRPEDICDLTYGCLKEDFEAKTVPCAMGSSGQDEGAICNVCPSTNR